MSKKSDFVNINMFVMYNDAELKERWQYYSTRTKADVKRSHRKYFDTLKSECREVMARRGLLDGQR